ncbi:hypothetical protein [Symbioplanes lichenis]|uniref:hypothetical protein n=1 Tax=Symbioplanes lichenis TaxID=1629072 RepID=UPI00273A3CAF|nr:hypothetical protein [Actinoplanes lichenis]
MTSDTDTKARPGPRNSGRGRAGGELDIADLATFDRLTTGERATAGLAFHREVDCLVDLAHLVATDFFDRPQLYRDVSDELAADLARLRARSGCDELVPSREQRAAVYSGVFGPAEATGPAPCFAGMRDQLLAAAAAFAERVYDTGADMLRAAVRVMHVYLRDYLLDVTGASVRWSRTQALPAVTEGLSYRILRDPGIAARFGVNQPPAPQWPYRPDANGAKLVEEASGQLGGGQRITRGMFNDRQQVALRGAEGLAAVIDYDGNPDPARVDVLIRRCYTWYAARGRVLHLPEPAPAPVAAATDGNRSLYDGARATLPSMLS